MHQGADARRRPGELIAFSGLKLTAEERALFKAAAPAGYILFKRNCDTPEQVRASHILLKTEGKNEEDVKKQAEDLAAKAKGGADFAAAGGVVEGPVGSGIGRLMRQRALVDFGVEWLPAHRHG